MVEKSPRKPERPIYGGPLWNSGGFGFDFPGSEYVADVERAAQTLVRRIEADERTAEGREYWYTAYCKVRKVLSAVHGMDEPTWFYWWIRLGGISPGRQLQSDIQSLDLLSRAWRADDGEGVERNVADFCQSTVWESLLLLAGGTVISPLSYRGIRFLLASESRSNLFCVSTVAAHDLLPKLQKLVCPVYEDGSREHRESDPLGIYGLWTVDHTLGSGSIVDPLSSYREGSRESPCSYRVSREKACSLIDFDTREIDIPAAVIKNARLAPTHEQNETWYLVADFVALQQGIDLSGLSHYTYPDTEEQIVADEPEELNADVDTHSHAVPTLQDQNDAVPTIQDQNMALEPAEDADSIIEKWGQVESSVIAQLEAISSQEGFARGNDAVASTADDILSMTELVEKTWEQWARRALAVLESNSRASRPQADSSRLKGRNLDAPDRMSIRTPSRSTRAASLRVRRAQRVFRMLQQCCKMGDLYLVEQAALSALAEASKQISPQELHINYTNENFGFGLVGRSRKGRGRRILVWHTFGTTVEAALLWSGELVSVLTDPTCADSVFQRVEGPSSSVDPMSAAWYALMLEGYFGRVQKRSLHDDDSKNSHQSPVSEKKHASMTSINSKNSKTIESAYAAQVNILGGHVGSNHRGSSVAVDPQRRTPDHRWMVRGHWRNQWYPSKSAHQLKWIHEHSAGPYGMPLLVTKSISVQRRRNLSRN